MSSYPLIIGHRGASAKAPENTMAAFQKAIDLGADGIEFDVRLSKDGVPVIIHDETFRRTAGRTELVSNLSAEELRTIDVGSWFSPEFKGEPVPTLEQLLNHLSYTDALLYLELKCAPAEVSRTAQTVCGMLAENPISDRVVVECFDLSAIAEVKRLVPHIKTAALFEPKVSDPASLIPGLTLIERAKSVDADEIALHHRIARKRTIEQARNAGLKVVVWTVDDPSWLAQSRESGIDCIITNDPALMLQHRNPTDAI